MRTTDVKTVCGVQNAKMPWMLFLYNHLAFFVQEKVKYGQWTAVFHIDVKLFLYPRSEWCKFLTRNFVIPVLHLPSKYRNELNTEQTDVYMNVVSVLKGNKKVYTSEAIRKQYFVSYSEFCCRYINEKMRQTRFKRQFLLMQDICFFQENEYLLDRRMLCLKINEELFEKISMMTFPKKLKGFPDCSAAFPILHYPYNISL